MKRDDVQLVVSHLNLDRTNDALALINRALAADASDLVAMAYLGSALRRSGDESEALRVLGDIVTRSDSGASKGALALAHYELGAHYMLRSDWPKMAVHLAQVASLQGMSGELGGKLVKAHARKEDWAGAKAWGAKTIETKEQEGRCAPDEVLPRERPKNYDPEGRLRNIISMSLFGDDPFYQQCAVTVARMAPALFPEFTCRFYCGPEIPQAVLAAIGAVGAQIIIVKPEGDQAGPKNWNLFWRFLAFDDPNVDVVMVRDVDCPPLPRERSAIDLWLKADAPFYVLRDHVVHAEPMHAGMWGGFTGLLPEMKPLIAKFVDAKSDRFADQAFLRLVIWPRIREATLCIDSNYNIGTTVDFPPYFPKFDRVHVGLGWTREEILGQPDAAS